MEEVFGIEEWTWSRMGSRDCDFGTKSEEQFGNVRTVRFCTVWERDVFGGEAALFSECWICHIYVDADVPVPIS